MLNGGIFLSSTLLLITSAVAGVLVVVVRLLEQEQLSQLVALLGQLGLQILQVKGSYYFYVPENMQCIIYLHENVRAN